MKKPKLTPAAQTAQDFLNVEDIDHDLIYTKDGYLFGFLQVRAGDGALHSLQEQQLQARRLATALGNEKEVWQLLSIPRTVDTFGMMQELSRLRRETQEDARLRLIDGEMTALQDMAREGLKEPVLVLKCWAKASKGADP